MSQVLDTSPAVLLARLRNASIGRAELFETVLFAEIAAFDEDETAELVEHLFDFVSKYRLAQEDDVKTAVGAAIRKLAMNLNDGRVEEYSELLLPSETETLPFEVELELTKAIEWRLTSNPAGGLRGFPMLEARLSEIALDYLKPRLILQKSYASTALHAVLGVLLLDGLHSVILLEAVRDLNIAWFSDLFLRRLSRLRTKMAEAADPAAQAVAVNLARAEFEFKNVPAAEPQLHASLAIRRD